MANVLELLELLRNPGEAEVPDTIYDDISASYSSEVSTWDTEREGHSTKIQELEGEISRLKAMNYDLLIASGANSEAESESESGADDGDDEGIDDLFG